MEPTESETNVPIARAPAGSYVRSKVISSYIEKNRFIGYNSATPDWSYAIKYTLYTGKTYKFPASITTKWGKASISGSYKNGGQIYILKQIQKENHV